MAALGAFVRAVSRHWLLLFTGPVLSLVLGGFEHYSGTSVPFQGYSLISAATVLAAVYRAWLDEHTARLTAEAQNERDRPAIVVSINEGERYSNQPPFGFKNLGSTPAFNIRFADVTIGSRTLEVDEIAEIGPEASAEPRAAIRGTGLFWARDVVQFFERGYEAVGRTQWPPTDEPREDAPNSKDALAASFGLGELVVPVAISYRDLGGVVYVTQQDVIFEPIADRISARLVYSGRAAIAPALGAAHIVAGPRQERKKLRT